MSLTPRRVEVLRLLCEGLSQKQIAAALGLSPETVNNHLRAIRRTLGVHNRHAAVAAAIRQGVVA